MFWCTQTHFALKVYQKDILDGSILDKDVSIEGLVIIHNFPSFDDDLVTLQIEKHIKKSNSSILALYTLATIPGWLSNDQVYLTTNKKNLTNLSLHLFFFTPLNLFAVHGTIHRHTPLIFLSTLLSPNERIRPVSREDGFLNSTRFHCFIACISAHAISKCIFTACVLHT